MMKARIVGWTTFEPPEDVPWEPEEWAWSTKDGGGQDLAEFSGRACYQSWSRPNPATASNRGYLSHIIEVGHESVLEHGTISVYITGVSRSLTHELVRHRHFSYCLSGDTKVYLDRPNRKSGDGKKHPSQTRTLEQLWEMSKDRRNTYVKTMTIRTVTDNGHVVHSKIKRVLSSGVKNVFRLTTADGNSIKASADHLFWRSGGEWSRLGDLSVGDCIIANGRSLIHDADWMRECVNEKNMSSKQIAQLAEVSESTVRKWRKRHGVPGQVGGYRGPAWNKGMSGQYTLPPHSEETKRIISEQKRGTKNPGWKGGFDFWANGHSAAGKKYAHLRAEGCRRCGYQQPVNPSRHDMLELDHIDGNANNNDISNVQPLCVPCHHAKTSGTPPMKVYPTEIVSIESVGFEPTFDLEMDGPYKRFVANGLVVHNSQLSQRYVDEAARKDELDPIVPPMFKEDHVAQVRLAISRARTLEDYDWLVDRAVDIHKAKRKQAREAARAVLQNDTETKIVVTGNYRAWRHFFHMRGSAAADAEIRELAIMLFQMVSTHYSCSNVFQDLFVKDDEIKGVGHGEMD